VNLRVVIEERVRRAQEVTAERVERLLRANGYDELVEPIRGVILP